MQLFGDLVERYRDFGKYADADSPCFGEWARGVAEDPDVLAWLGGLPQPKQQPNLVFAAARWHGVPAPAPYAVLREALLGDDGRIRDTIWTRSTQTNEVGRLATLTPVLAQIAAGGPVALVEVGASAGLCLYPDRWSYAWTTPDGEVITPDGAGPLRCRVSGPAPLPPAAPEVAWRGGVDLNPLDVTDPDQAAWLRQLVWPEHDDRRAVLDEAVTMARADPPHVRAGDLSTVPDLVAEAAGSVPGPGRGQVVVFHSAVLAYVEEEGRRSFEATMAELVADGACHWISNEGPDVHPGVTATGPAPPEGLATFVLGLDGRAVAWTHGHGRSLAWLG